MEITFDDHPAKQVTTLPGGETITEPLIKDMMLVRLNGLGVGYLSLNNGQVAMNRKQGGGKWPPSVCDAIQEAAASYLKAQDIQINQPPELPTEDDS